MPPRSSGSSRSRLESWARRAIGFGGMLPLVGEPTGRLSHKSAAPASATAAPAPSHPSRRPDRGELVAQQIATSLRLASLGRIARVSARPGVRIAVLTVTAASHAEASAFFSPRTTHRSANEPRRPRAGPPHRKLRRHVYIEAVHRPATPTAPASCEDRNEAGVSISASKAAERSSGPLHDGLEFRVDHHRHMTLVLREVGNRPRPSRALALHEGVGRARRSPTRRRWIPAPPPASVGARRARTVAARSTPRGRCNPAPIPGSIPTRFRCRARPRPPPLPRPPAPANLATPPTMSAPAPAGRLTSSKPVVPATAVCGNLVGPPQIVAAPSPPHSAVLPPPFG